MAQPGTALITGAAGGLGRSFATALAARGYNLVLSDRTPEQLEKVADEIRTLHAVNIQLLAVDLADRAQLEKLAGTIGRCDELEILVNNAGFGNPGPFAETDLSRTIEMIDVHVVASTRLCRAALPGMIDRRRGAIINMSSLSGFRPGVGDATYDATKRYLMYFSKCLQAEVKKSGVKVQALCPGYTRTGFFHTADYSARTRSVPRFFWMDPDEVVAHSLAALGNRKVVCIPGFMNRLLLVLLYLPFVVRLIRAVARRIP